MIGCHDNHFAAQFAFCGRGGVKNFSPSCHLTLHQVRSITAHVWQFSVRLLTRPPFWFLSPLLLCRQRVSIPYDRNEHQDCSILFGDWLLGEWGPGGRPAPFSIPPDQPICVKSNCNRSRPAVAGIVASWAKKPRPSSRGSRSVGNGIISQAAWPGP